VIAVIGAGPAGLALAWRAARAGHEVVVVEREPHVGGMAASFEVAGVRVDHGSHRLHPTTAAPILAALRGLLGNDLQTRHRHGRVRLAGRWVAFPLRPLDLARRLPPRLAAAAAVDAASAPVRRARADTFAEVVRAGLGPTVAGSFYAPYVRKLWDADPADLSGELARRRVGAATSGAIVHRLLRNGRGRTFLYPRTGFGAIVERLADAAVDTGAEILTGSAVTEIHPTDDGVTLTIGDGRGRPLNATRVFSTIPPAALAGVMRPPPPDDVLAAARRLRHRALVLVYLVVGRRRWTDYDAHYFPGPEVPASRVSEPKNYRDNPDDPPDRTVLCAEVPCWVGDETWSARPTALGERLATTLAAIGLPDPSPVHVEVRRLPHVYPVYRPGFEWDLSALDLWLGNHPRVVTLGRQGLFVPDNTHHALAMAWDAAAALDDTGDFDHHAWAAARDRFRAHVVED
jgi:protoporphyrinogen oxidase